MIKTFFSILGWFFVFLLALLLLAKAWIHFPYVDIEEIAPGVLFDFPLHVEFLETADGQRILVSEKGGVVKSMAVDSASSFETVLDISDQVYWQGHEEGLLSSVVDPRFPERSYLYVFYSLDNPKSSRVSRFNLSSELIADKSSELVIIEIDKVRDTHNGGLLKFDRHGYLLVSVGDSEASGEYGRQMQTRQTLLGTILRLDVSESSHDSPYLIPQDNPFIHLDDGSLPEIWAYGFRNPWRYTYNKSTDTILVADVGSDLRETVKHVEKGTNHGWPVVEGDVCRSDMIGFGDCDDESIVQVLGAFPQTISRAPTGSVLYRGELAPSLRGRIIFSDYLRGVFSFAPSQTGEIVTSARSDMYKWPTTRGPNAGRVMRIASISEGPDHEIYVVNAHGIIGRLKELSFTRRIRGMFYGMLNF